MKKTMAIIVAMMMAGAGHVNADGGKKCYGYFSVEHMKRDEAAGALPFWWMRTPQDEIKKYTDMLCISPEDVLSGPIENTKHFPDTLFLGEGYYCGHTLEECKKENTHKIETTSILCGSENCSLDDDEKLWGELLKLNPGKTKEQLKEALYLESKPLRDEKGRYTRRSAMVAFERNKKPSTQ
jgi:hypothetical protein